MLKALGKRAAQTLDQLVAGLGDSNPTRKLDRSNGTYMPLYVERLDERRVSISHYFEQNGDLVPDPDMSFWRGNTGDWFAVDCTMATGYYTRAIEFGANGVPEGVRPRASRELASFAAMWLRNIKDQQELGSKITL